MTDEGTWKDGNGTISWADVLPHVRNRIRVVQIVKSTWGQEILVWENIPLPSGRGTLLEVFLGELILSMVCYFQQHLSRILLQVSKPIYLQLLVIRQQILDVPSHCRHFSFLLCIESEIFNGSTRHNDTHNRVVAVFPFLHPPYLPQSPLPPTPLQPNATWHVPRSETAERRLPKGAAV